MNAVPTDTPILATPPPTDEVGWAEPTSRLALRWGGYPARYPVGLALLVAAALAAYRRFWWDDGSFLLGMLLVAGIVVVGVLVMPATAGRRALAALVALVALTGYGLWLSGGEAWRMSAVSWRMSAVVTGVLAVLAWLILRDRSGRSYAVALPVGAVAVLVFRFLGDVIWVRGDLGHHWWLANAIVILGWVGAAWLARAVEPRFSVGRTGREDARERTQAQAAARGIDEQVRQMAELQAAWERAHPGQPMPAVAAPMLARSGGTNTLAILSLVFGIMGGGVVPVILGHLARAQIRRTGEAGDGMAVAGLVLRYLGIAILVAYLVFVVGLLNSLS